MALNVPLRPPQQLPIVATMDKINSSIEKVKSANAEDWKHFLFGSYSYK